MKTRPSIGALGRLKKQFKQRIQAVLRTPKREAILIRAAHGLPVAWHGKLRKLVPQPRSYASGDVRLVTRYGMRWQLHPAEYFQWHQYFGFADAVLDTLRSLARPGDRVCDVGANIGFYTAVMAQRVGSGGLVFSFEPSPRTYQRLLAHVTNNALDNVRCFDVALGAAEQASTLNDFGGNDSGKSSLRAAAGQSDVPGTEVRVRTLDRVLAEQGEVRVDLLKIDVEGFEPEVLAGAMATISRDLPAICLEWSPAWHAGREQLAGEALARLERLGYRCFEISSSPSTHGRLMPLRWGDLNQTYNLLLLTEADARGRSLIQQA